MLQVVVVPVPAGKGEPAHEHADVRYVLATGTPDEVVPERPSARLRWATVDEARVLVDEANVHEALSRLEKLRASGRTSTLDPELDLHLTLRSRSRVAPDQGRFGGSRRTIGSSP